ncbi:MAG: hypothetical protein GY729_00730 [Desulfobacteraceae bacterium]|nr:hypothetical protein [Desulfobacteraceae bacterium]
MDMGVVGIVAVAGLIIGPIIAFMMKKPIIKILLFAGIGFIVGAGAGYCIAPFVISFL